MRLQRLAALLATFVALVACSDQDAVPTLLVEPQPFQQRVTAEGFLKPARATAVSVPAEVHRTVRLAWLAPQGDLVKGGEVVARFDPLEMEERLQETRSDFEVITLETRQTKIRGTAKRARLAADLTIADLELEHARRFQKVSDLLFSRHDIISEEIDEQLASDRRQHAADSGTTEQELNQTELDLLAIRRRQTQHTIDETEKGLSALTVTAPHDGLFTLVRHWTGPLQVGTEMWRGQDLGKIPDLSLMEAEVFVLEADAGGLAPGKPAQLVVEARPEVVYDARIRLVDTIAKPRFRGSPVHYFGVTLELETEVNGTVLKPGQRVRAILILEDVEEALVIPRQAVFQDQDGGKHVYLRNGHSFVTRQIEIGAGSVGLVMVTEGLAAGDVIALRRPYELDQEAEEDPGSSPG
jgi:multidrug efflux pump subunit AcrA (membrane-fusion protein)